VSLIPNIHCIQRSLLIFKDEKTLHSYRHYSGGSRDPLYWHAGYCIWFPGITTRNRGSDCYLDCFEYEGGPAIQWGRSNLPAEAEGKSSYLYFNSDISLLHGSSNGYFTANPSHFGVPRFDR